mgnify:CR=1 FL=1
MLAMGREETTDILSTRTFTQELFEYEFAFILPKIVGIQYEFEEYYSILSFFFFFCKLVIKKKQYFIKMIKL